MNASYDGREYRAEFDDGVIVIAQGPVPTRTKKGERDFWMIQVSSPRLEDEVKPIKDFNEYLNAAVDQWQII